jgi:type IV pilus assembly protein PilE
MQPTPQCTIKPSQPGFTLIETIMVIGIMAILAALVYPAYTRHFLKSRRIEAQTTLLELSQFMERHYTRQGSYLDAQLPITRLPQTGPAHYHFSLDPLAAQSYTLNAIPTPQQEVDGCGTLSLTQTGAKIAEAEQCWK